MITARVIMLAGIVILAACDRPAAAPLTASNVELTRPLPGMNMSAGYLTLENASGDAIEITHITSPQFGSVEMHESIVENDISRMERLHAITISPGQTIHFERGGKHIMLMEPIDALTDVTLNLHSGDTLLLSVNASIGNGN